MSISKLREIKDSNMRRKCLLILYLLSKSFLLVLREAIKTQLIPHGQVMLVVSRSSWLVTGMVKIVKRNRYSIVKKSREREENVELKNQFELRF